MFKRAKYVILAFVVGATFLAPVFVQPLNAQVLYGSVVGTVTDQTGALVPKAAVTIVNKATGATLVVLIILYLVLRRLRSSRRPPGAAVDPVSE